MKTFRGLLLGFGLAAILLGGNNSDLAKIDDGFKFKESRTNSSVLEYHIPAY